MQVYYSAVANWRGSTPYENCIADIIQFGSYPDNSDVCSLYTKMWDHGFRKITRFRAFSRRAFAPRGVSTMIKESKNFPYSVKNGGYFARFTHEGRPCTNISIAMLIFNREPRNRAGYYSLHNYPATIITDCNTSNQDMHLRKWLER